MRLGILVNETLDLTHILETQTIVSKKRLLHHDVYYSQNKHQLILSKTKDNPLATSMFCQYLLDHERLDVVLFLSDVVSTNQASELIVATQLHHPRFNVSFTLDRSLIALVKQLVHPTRMSIAYLPLVSNPEHMYEQLQTSEDIAFETSGLGVAQVCASNHIPMLALYAQPKQSDKLQQLLLQVCEAL
ncbi:MAG: hypothetical protein ACRCZJ_03325 [Erysipelotrichaceae bacterium]